MVPKATGTRRDDPTPTSRLHGLINKHVPKPLQQGARQAVNELRTELQTTLNALNKERKERLRLQALVHRNVDLDDSPAYAREEEIQRIAGKRFTSGTLLKAAVARVRGVLESACSGQFTKIVQVLDFLGNRFKSVASRLLSGTKVAMAIMASIAARVQALRETCRGRYPQHVRQVLHTLCTFVAQRPCNTKVSSREIAQHLGLKPMQVRAASTTWQQFVSNDNYELLAQARGKERSDKLPEEWKQFMVTLVWLGETRESGYRKDALRNPHNRADKTAYRFHFLETTLAELHQRGLEMGKARFGPNFHFSYTQFILLRPFNVKSARREQCLCRYCLRFYFLADALRRLRVKRTETGVTTCDCVRFGFKNQHELRHLLLCERPASADRHADACILRTCSSCGPLPSGALPKLPLCRHELAVVECGAAATAEFEAAPLLNSGAAAAPGASAAGSRAATINEIMLTQWQKVVYKRKDGSEKLTYDFRDVIVPVPDVVAEFTEYLPPFLLHLDLATWQDRDWKLQREVRPGTAASVQDFSENWSAAISLEHQSRYFAGVAATLYPVVVYTHIDDRVDIDEARKEELRAHFDKHELEHVLRDELIVISEDMQHDAAFVVHVNDKIITPWLKKHAPNVAQHEGRSDGCAAQYKCSTFFLWVASRNKVDDVVASWSFFGSAHGKAESDGAGGALKLAARVYELSRMRDGTIRKIDSAHELFNFAQHEYGQPKGDFLTPDGKRHVFKRHFFFVPVQGDDRVVRGLPRCETLKGTKLIHQIKGVPGSDGLLMARTRGCHCSVCISGAPDAWAACPTPASSVLMKQYCVQLRKLGDPTAKQAAAASKRRDAAMAASAVPRTFFAAVEPRTRRGAARESWFLFAFIDEAVLEYSPSAAGAHAIFSKMCCASESDGTQAFRYVTAVAYKRLGTGAKIFERCDGTVLVPVKAVVLKDVRCKNTIEQEGAAPMVELQEGTARLVANELDERDRLARSMDVSMLERAQLCLKNGRHAAKLATIATLHAAGDVTYEDGCNCDGPGPDGNGCTVVMEDMSSSVYHCDTCSTDFCSACEDMRVCTRRTHVVGDFQWRGSCRERVAVGEDQYSGGFKCAVCKKTTADPDARLARCMLCKVDLCATCDSKRTPGGGGSLGAASTSSTSFGESAAEPAAAQTLTCDIDEDMACALIGVMADMEEEEEGEEDNDNSDVPADVSSAASKGADGADDAADDELGNNDAAGRADAVLFGVDVSGLET